MESWMPRVNGNCPGGPARDAASGGASSGPYDGLTGMPDVVCGSVTPPPPRGPVGQHPQLAAGIGLVARIGDPAADHQVAVEVRHQRADVARVLDLPVA